MMLLIVLDLHVALKWVVDSEITNAPCRTLSSRRSNFPADSFATQSVPAINSMNESSCCRSC